MRALGIDPGTKSFDLCGMENGNVFYEKVLDSAELANNPHMLVEAVEEALPLDFIAGPSGYGVGLTLLKDLDIEILEQWYLTYILLLKKEDMEAALQQKNPGIMVYSAMTKSALEMKRKDLPVGYLPGVINMPTVPLHRKLNNLDMGTVDKLSCAVLGVFDQSERLHIPYSEVSFLMMELGAGYTAGLAVDKGRIVDGIGGTMNGIGFLSSGVIDMEMIQLGRSWEKTDVFSGGIMDIVGENTFENFIANRAQHTVAWNRMMEDVEKTAASLAVSVREPREILLSGRLTRFDEVREELSQRLGWIAPTRKVGFYPGASEVKEAAQGYAMLAEGLAGGRFSELVEHMKIRDAKGTALDYIYHPKGLREVKKMRERISFP